MKRLDLNALRVFVTVAENGSFSAGAKALQMPSSNVSRQISQLEQSLQLRLIQRSTRHMKLTSAGQTLLASMRPVLEQLAATEAELTQQQAEPEGLLRLCLPNEIGPSLFAPLMAQFALRYPKITVSCTTNLAGMEVLKEDVDIAVIITRGKMEDISVIARPLFSFPCCVVASPQLIARTGMPTDSEQLTSLPCITTVSALAGQAWQFAAAGALKRLTSTGTIASTVAKWRCMPLLPVSDSLFWGNSPAARLLIAGSYRKSRLSYRRRRYSFQPSIGSAILCPPECASGLNLSRGRWQAKRLHPAGVR